MEKTINVLVTGANGQLGLALRDESKNHKGINFHFYNSSELDITKKNSIETLVTKTAFDFCINCAAYTNVELAETEYEKAYDVNFNGVKNLVDAFQKTNTTLIHISTDYVFDGKKKEPYIEEDETNPINIYGQSKLAGEVYIKEKSKRYYIIRTSWLYSENGNNFLNTVINKLLNGDIMTIGQNQQGVPTGCGSLSRFIIHLVKSKRVAFGVYNFSAKGKTNWYNYANKIAKQLQANNIKTPKIICGNGYQTIAKRPQNSLLNTSKAQEIYSSIYSWEIEVKETIIKILSKK